ncbi:MAG: enoyl-CoA hydratase-related protein [Gammaproteobacteria bacterium]
MSKPLIVETDDRGVVTLTLDRPRQHNALDAALIAALLAACEDIDKDASVRVVVLTGAGKSFCAGADLKYMQDMVNADAAANREDANRLARMLNTLYGLGRPTIARVNGAAFGGGVGLIACCDYAIAASDVSLALSESRLGLVPATISPYVINAIGPRRAKQYFMNSAKMDAAEAQRIGLVDRSAEPTGLDEAVDELARQLLACGPLAITECKRLVHHLVPIREEAMEYTSELIARIRTSAEGQEGMLAFLEKRKPRWQL